MKDPRTPVLEAFAAHRCSAILRSSHAEAVGPAMESAVQGGFRVIELTLTTPGALEHLREFARRGDLVVGAGTVLTLEEADAARAAGARFLVSPVADPEVIGYCREHGLVSVPGAYTPAEMLMAHRAGADIVKLFPGPADGPAYVRACLGPMPFLKLFPTAGVTDANAAAFLRAGAHGVGFVGCLFDPADMAAGDYEAIRRRAARMVAAVRGA